MARCRRAAPGITGYRPPQSRLTPELVDGTLVAHGFQWLAGSAASLGTAPRPSWKAWSGIPIHFDDHALYARGLPFPTWEGNALARIQARPLTGFSLHDCYGQFWLPHYRAFLARVRGLGQLMTLGELASRLRRPAGSKLWYRWLTHGQPRAPALRQEDAWLERAVRSGLEQTVPSKWWSSPPPRRRPATARSLLAWPTRRGTGSLGSRRRPASRVP